jgi:hypothetical protein
MAKAKEKKAKKVYPPNIAPPIEDVLAGHPGTPQELAQEALDALSTAIPSVGAGGEILRVLRQGSYNDIESRLSQIIDS